MSVIFQKKADGSLKAWVVSVRRNSQVYTKYFRPNQEEEARRYNEKLLLELPAIVRSGPKKGVKGRANKNVQPIKMNGCIIKKAAEGIRCSKNAHCENYSACSKAVAIQDWPGFTD